MTSILLVNPANNFLIKDGDRPPLGLMYLSSFAKAYGGFRDDEIELIDMAHEDWSFLNSELKATKPDYVGITVSTPTYNSAIAIARTVKVFSSESKIIAGGTHVSALPNEELSQTFFDHIVVGEGEQAFLDIVSGKEKGKIVQCPLIADLDSIPLPDRQLVDMNQYQMNIEGKKATTLITSRGCPYGCCYCTKKVFGRTWRARSANDVAMEVGQLYHDYGMKGVYFFDDSFTVDKQRVFDICDKIKDYNIVWRATTRADLLSKELLEKMHDSGMDILSIGVESGNNRVLKKCGKGMTKQQNEQAVKWCKSIGIKTKLFFIVGLPGDTAKTIQDTITFAKKLDSDYIDWYPLSPFPATDLWDFPEKYDMQIDKPQHSYEWDGYYEAGKEIVPPIHVSNKNLSKNDIVFWLQEAKASVKNKGIK